MNHTDVLIIGGGAAGIIAARRAAELGARVTLLEKNPRLGMKILISGGGKCNLTHDGAMEDVRRRFRRNEALFLKPAFYRFTNRNFLDILHTRGMRTYTRPDGRIFPVEPADAKDVVRHLTDYVTEAGVEIVYNCPVTALDIDPPGAMPAALGGHAPAEGLRIRGAFAGDRLYRAKSVIIAAGGSSYPATGTTGDAWRWLRDAGHSIVPLRAALAPIYFHHPHTDWSGIALRDIVLKARSTQSRKGASPPPPSPFQGEGWGEVSYSSSPLTVLPGAVPGADAPLESPSEQTTAPAPSPFQGEGWGEVSSPGSMPKALDRHIDTVRSSSTNSSFPLPDSLVPRSGEGPGVMGPGDGNSTFHIPNSTFSSKELSRWSGDVLFTHKGISGPCALAISRDIADYLEDRSHAAIVEVDLAPALSFEQLQDRLRREIKVNPRRTVTALIDAFVPSRLVEAVLADADCPVDTRLSNLPTKTLNRIISTLKGWKLGDVRHIPIERGEVVAGGIDLTEVDPRSMASTVVDGLFLCGEVLDIAGPVGGYNLQAAWSTGYVAGESAANRARK